jgi:PAS domain S-box-containing protein
MHNKVVWKNHVYATIQGMTSMPDFHALFRVSPYPYLVMDLDLNIIGANDAYLRSTGRTESELLGRYVFDAFPPNPDDPGSTAVDEVRSSLLYAIACGQPHTTAFVRYSVPHDTAEGKVFEERFWSTVHTPVKDASGKVAFVAQNAIDVTDLYRFDRAAQVAAVEAAPKAQTDLDHFGHAQMHEAMNRIINDERSHLRNLFNQAPGFIAVLTGEKHVFEMVNEAYYQLVGHRELIGKPVWQALPEVRGQGFEELLDRVTSSGQPFVGRGVKLRVQPVAGGPVSERYIDMLYQPIFKNGRASGIFVQGHDVTDAYTAQLAEQVSAERLSEGMNAARMVVWDWDIATRAMAFSDNAQLVLGRGEGNIDTISESIDPHDAARLLAARERAFADKSGYQEIVRFKRPDDGRVLWLDIRGKVRCGADGEPVAVRGVTLDITERIKAEEDLRDAHRRKDEFLAMLAHELRNPLAPISSAAQLLRHARLDETRLRDITDIIIRQVGHITSLVDDLIDVSRVTRGLISTDKRPQNMQGIVNDAVEQVRPAIEARRHTLTVSMPGQAVSILGDQKRVVQVITNLLNNAAKYTPAGGHIALEMTHDHAWIRLAVRDDGIGISPELLPRVFDLFTQGERSADRAQGGLGVGLAVVKSLAELHGGHVQAESEGHGKGSLFTLTLPLLELAPGVDAPALAAATTHTGALRIMVVDDNPDAALMLSMLLEATGYEVFTENSSHAGLARAQAVRPDVCLLDIGLPNMDGYQLAQQILALPGMAHATLIAITGYGQEQDRSRTREAGFDHHLVKPVDPVELAALLAALAA